MARPGQTRDDNDDLDLEIGPTLNEPQTEDCPVCEGWGAYCDKHRPATCRRCGMTDKEAPDATCWDGGPHVWR